MNISTTIRRASLLTLVMVLLAGSAWAAGLLEVRDTIKRSFDVRPGGTLVVDIDRGNIEVETTSGNTVYVEMERIVKVDSREEAKLVLEDHEWDMFRQGDDVRIESRFEPERGNWRKWRDHDRFELRVRVRVPESYNVDFTNGAGNITIEDLDGQIEGQTGAGNIEIGTVRGTLEVHTGAGNVTVDGAQGRVEVNSGAGNVVLRNVDGEIRANTGAGNITAHITRQPEGNSRLESGAGNVTVYLDDDVSVDVDAVASVGSASTDFPLRVQGKWMHKSFSGEVNGGGPALRMRSGVGNVTLRRL